MTSFIRTIPINEKPLYVADILSRADHYIPLPFTPRRANVGDFIYLSYRHQIVGRAVIEELAIQHSQVRISSSRQAYNAKCLIKYRGTWQVPNRKIPFEGKQGIRYLDYLGLNELDSEEWY